MHHRNSLARDRGFTRPGCTVAGAHCQVHHAVNDWAHDGQTNVDDLTLACPKDNRSVKPGGWKTRKRKDGRTEWIPPPHLDRGNHGSTTTTTQKTTYYPTRAKNPPRTDARGGLGQHATSTYTVIAVTVVTMSSIAPGAPESIRENV